MHNTGKVTGQCVSTWNCKGTLTRAYVGIRRILFNLKRVVTKFYNENVTSKVNVFILVCIPRTFNVSRRIQ